MNLEKVKKLNIPKTPGCYQFLEKDKIIYVGKAINLKSRVLSYWQKSSTHTPAKYAMLKKIDNIKWIETDSEVEALLLEANLIKKYKPEFNIVMRDDKRYVYIKISTEEKWPRIFMTRKIDPSGRYFGPFTSAEAVRQTLKIIRKIWPFRSCRSLPKKVCLYYRINKCLGMCEGLADEKDYKKIIKQIILFLEGKKNKIIKELEAELKTTEKKLLKINSGDEKYEEISKQSYFLKKQLLNLNTVVQNAKIIGLTEKYAVDVLELAKVLNLPQVPNRIEGYDISNIFGQEAVGSMVVFSEGEADKNEYRKFKIKSDDSLGDVGMLKEMMERRLAHADWPLPDLMIIDGGKAQLNVVLAVMKKNKLDLPILAVSKGSGLRSAIAPDKIFFPKQKKPLELPLASPALHVVKRVRDEAHRFAISYYRQLKRRKMFKT